MGCAKFAGPGRWHYTEEDNGRARGPRWGKKRRRYGTSGNRAFDEYREETLRRLEDEQLEFTDFLERLRHARDKAEFDQFMADRARRAEEIDASDNDNGNGEDKDAPRPKA